METRPQVENVLDDAREINQVVITANTVHRRNAFGPCLGKRINNLARCYNMTPLGMWSRRVSQFLAASLAVTLGGVTSCACSGTAANATGRGACARFHQARSDRAAHRGTETYDIPELEFAQRETAGTDRGPRRLHANVVIVLIDNVGFGGQDRSADRHPHTDAGPAWPVGIHFDNFHTTALCSPTRNALKTGRNHHTVNTG